MTTTQRLEAMRAAAAGLRHSSSSQRSDVLKRLAAAVSENYETILAANRHDLAQLPASATPAFRDRLLLDEARLEHAAVSLRQVAAEGDPLAEEVERRRLANGLLVRRVRAPLGVIFLIFESRPNVALEAFSLAVRSGNAIILRGGKESKATLEVIYRLIEGALRASGLPETALWGIVDPDRELVKALLQETRYIDVVVPRGGEALIEFVVTHSRIPLIKNDRGLCHVYVHEDADLPMAVAIVENAKTSRPGVCNAMETLLVHEKIAARLLPLLHDTLAAKRVEWIGCDRTVELLKGRLGVTAATPQSWDREYLDLKMSCRVVGSLTEAISHIEAHGSHHSECIVTASEEAARRFQAEVDAAAVYWNASTRFTDGFELGLGGELGISTQKLHVRGPVGLKELTSVRWVIDGTGQRR